MKKKILVFLVFAGFLLVGGLNVNSVSADVCGTCAGTKSVFPTPCTPCGSGGTLEAGYIDDGNWGTTFNSLPPGESSGPWICMSPDLAGGSVRNICKATKSGTVSAPAPAPASPTETCCGTFNGQTYSAWPNTTSGFCGTVSTGKCELVPATYSFPSNSSNANWKCKWPLSTYESSCTATKTASAPATSCDDKMKNGTETGIDCGGGCRACEILADCSPKPTTGTIWNDGGQTDGKFTRTWDGSVYQPTSKNTGFNTAIGDCHYICDANHNWNDTTRVCVPKTTNPATPVAPVVTAFSASPNPVESGGDILLRRTITGVATSCVVTDSEGRDTNVNNATGTFSDQFTVVENIGNVNIIKRYSIKCFNGTAVSNAMPVDVTIKPVVSTASQKPTAIINSADTTKAVGTGTASGDAKIEIVRWYKGSCDGINLVNYIIDPVQSYTHTFEYPETLTESTNLYFQVRDTNDQFSECVSREITIDMPDKCLGINPVDVGGIKCFSSEDGMNSANEKTWTDVKSGLGCDPEKKCQYYIPAANEKPKYSCTGNFPSQEDVKAGKYAYCSRSICGPTCGLTQDTPAKQVASKDACSGANCEYYVPSANSTSCQGTKPLNSTPWGSDGNDSLGTWKYSASDTADKCEYKCNAGFQWFKSDIISGCQPSAMPAPPTVTCDTTGKLSISWQSVVGEKIWYALRIDDKTDETGPWAGDVPIDKDAVINNLTTTSYNEYPWETGKTYRVWVNAVVENGVNDIWGDRTGNLVTLVTCSDNQNDVSDAEDIEDIGDIEEEDTTPDVVNLGLCGPAGSFDRTQPKTYDWSVSEFTENLCVYGESNPLDVILKMGKRVNWTCYNETKTTSQKCYAKRNSNGNIDTTPDEDDSTTLTCGGAVPENANLCAGDDTGLTSETNNSILAPGKDCSTKKCEYICNAGFRRKGNSCVADDNTIDDSNPKCGTANKKFYESTDVDFGEDTLCAKGIASPLEPVFPGEGKIVEWKCSESGNWWADTIRLKKVVSCVSARKNEEINPGCGDASGVYDENKRDFRSENYCADGFNLSSVKPTFPTTAGTTVDWVCRPNLLNKIFTNKQPVVCSATGGYTSGNDTEDDNDNDNDSSGAPIGTGTGLLAKYFNNHNFTAQQVTQVDPVINFNWGLGKPNPSIEADTFSIRWTGQVQPKYDGEWTFYVTADDGVRLWVNDQLLVDKWIDQNGTEYAGKINLNAGQKYNIKMEYYENGGYTVAQLAWSHAKQGEEIIPQTQLYNN